MPDIFVLQKSGNLPALPVLVSDVKNSDQGAAEKETALYALSAMDQCNPNKSILLLGFPCTTSEIALKTYVCVNKIILDMTIVRGLMSEQDLMPSLGTLYCCVHALIDSPIISEDVSNIGDNCCSGSHSVFGIPHGIGYTRASPSPRVIYCVAQRLVKKYYDKDYHKCENIQSNRKYLPGASIEELNSRVSVLQYEYIEGTHEPTCIEHVVGAIRMLSKLHSEGLVHSDIRKDNLVFNVDKKTAHLIDFDLADMEGKSYPLDYNSTGIPERHNQAISGAKRNKIHDRYSLFQIIVNEMGQDFVAKHKGVENLPHINVTLDEILQELMVHC